MSVHIENLHVGDWVTGCTDLRADGEFGVYGRHIAFDGIPWKVKAISAPFIVAERNGNVVTFDLRVVGMTKLSAAYVRALKGLQDPAEDPSKTRVGKKRRIKTK